jgi:hypothetical protein
LGEAFFVGWGRDGFGLWTGKFRQAFRGADLHLGCHGDEGGHINRRFGDLRFRHRGWLVGSGLGQPAAIAVLRPVRGAGAGMEAQNGREREVVGHRQAERGEAKPMIFATVMRSD